MLTIMNAALIAEGLYEIVAENDGSLEFRLLSQQWPLIVEAELEAGNYNFTRETAQLLTRIDGKYGFQDGYQIPGSALHVRRVWLDGTLPADGIPWGQDSAYVYVDNASGCWAEYLVASEADVWSATFSRGVQLKLQAVICRFKEESVEARDRDAMAEDLFGKARAKSSQRRSTKSAFRRGPIGRARRGQT